MHPIYRFFSILFIYSLISCTDEAPAPSSGTIDPVTDLSWSLPEHRIFDGGPGRDGIPSIDNPIFEGVEPSDDWLKDEELVVAIKIGEEIHVYPYQIMDYHEIVNDQIQSEFFALTYCPLTGTALAWNRNLELGVTTFGVSGLLFNTNLIPYERETGSEWSQILGSGIHGRYKDEVIEEYRLLEGSWKSVKRAFPESNVLSLNTGYDRPYGIYPYGDYKEANARLLFPIIPLDERLPLKERVLGVIIDENCKVFRFKSFENDTRVLLDEFMDIPLVIVGHQKLNYMTAFVNKTADGTMIVPEPDFHTDVTFADQEGNEWNLFGEAVSGPRQGERLEDIRNFMGYWLAFGSFYPKPEINEL